MINLSLQRHALLALLAAALFGASPPLAKLLVGELSPMLLAGLLYLGSGLGLCVVWLVRSLRGGARAAPVGEAPLQRGDYPWLGGAILSGGVLAPVLLMWGLSGADAASASLLLSAEGVMTTLLAVLFFREAVGGRVWLACLVMLAGGVLLSHDEHGAWGFSPHAVAVLAACVLWGLDNNLTRHISSGDAVVIAMIKGLVAGGINLVLGLVLGYTLPSWGPVAAALGLGAASYGASLVLYVLALRHLGSARTAAHFGTAPFIGAGLSVLLLGEPLTVMLLVAVALMAVASWLVLTERHAHEHGHELLQHVHEHVHDEHHQHIHGEETDVGPHTHAHSHAPLRHSHAHLPDIHHRHGH
jgi:drug/metabolite transporter (DMT)-like permease